MSLSHEETKLTDAEFADMTKKGREISWALNQILGFEQPDEKDPSPIGSWFCRTMDKGRDYRFYKKDSPTVDFQYRIYSHKEKQRDEKAYVQDFIEVQRFRLLHEAIREVTEMTLFECTVFGGAYTRGIMIENIPVAYQKLTPKALYEIANKFVEKLEKETKEGKEFRETISPQSKEYRMSEAAGKSKQELVHQISAAMKRYWQNHLDVPENATHKSDPESERVTIRG